MYCFALCICVWTSRSWRLTTFLDTEALTVVTICTTSTTELTSSFTQLLQLWSRTFLLVLNLSFPYRKNCLCNTFTLLCVVTALKHLTLDYFRIKMYVYHVLIMCMISVWMGRYCPHLLSWTLEHADPWWISRKVQDWFTAISGHPPNSYIIDDDKAVTWFLFHKKVTSGGNYLSTLLLITY